MKKNISINISGIIFHIEEDGYEVLKKYLDSINKYFSSFEDSSEILSDIESRIAEIFLSKLNEGKQIITAEDVNALVSTMGSVNDFKAAEDQEFAQNDTAQAGPQPQSEHAHSERTHYAAKNLHRDQGRKILGGVCAGLGNYFNVDPVWVRLFFALLTFAWGFGVLVYVILWIALPGSFTLEEARVNRKLYRDDERRVIGGVAGGLAAYFGIDIVVIRLLFVGLAFVGGFGLIAYIVLWIVTPAAVTITDKMEMQGEPVTLSNIESNIKKNFNLRQDEENAFVKVLLFPFRLIGWILTGLGKLIYPLMEVLRVAAGILVTFTGLSWVFSIIVITGIFFGLLSGTAVPIHLGVPFNEASLPIEAMSRAIPTLTLVSAFVASLLPGIILTLLGISIIAKRIVFSALVGWSMFVLFLASLLVLSFTIPKVIYSFKQDGKIETEAIYPVTAKRIVLRVNEIGLDDYIRPYVHIEGYNGKDIKLVQRIESQGSSRQIAMENAKMVDYHVTVQDSVYTFDSNLQFKKDGVFRGQHVSLTLYVPYDYPVYIDPYFRLGNIGYYNGNEFQGNTWAVSKETKDLHCISCPVVEKTEEEAETERMNTMSGYNELEINGMFDVTISQEPGTHALEINGTEDEEKKYKVSQVGEKLIIEYSGTKNYDWKSNPLNLKETKIKIRLPELKSIKLKGAGDVNINNFTVDDLDIEAFGVVKVKGEVHAGRVTVNLAGVSQLELLGRGESLDALVQGASRLRAFDYTVQNAIVETNGTSSAKVTVNGRLELKEGVASKISYQGSPTEVIKE